MVKIKVLLADDQVQAGGTLISQEMASKMIKSINNTIPADLAIIQISGQQGFGRMTGPLEKAPSKGLLVSKGNDPTQAVITACCNAFANYIYSEL